MKINEFVNKTQVAGPMLVVACKSGVTNANAPYLSITFRDNTGTIEGKLWDVRDPQLEIVRPGRVIMVKGEVISYRNQLQLKVLDVEETDNDVIDMSEYVLTGPYSQPQLRAMIEEAIHSLNNQDIFRIVSDVFRTYDRQIYSSAAAVRNHHEYYGGLATHICGMLKLADMMVVNYPYLNRDLLVAGVLLHDIGKVVELSEGTVTEYTLEGKLIGHISIAQTIIKQTADKLGIDSEAVLLLRHMVLSHHGEHEFGSPVLPATIEAEALHYIDDIDAKMTMIEKELSAVGTKEFTQRNFALENRSFYKHDIK
ncbi:MAG: HD domain-containing protein [Erysipelotrichaceae bacterium]|nr:HD domain-containing protein [Erysipelotrichaceae bacterium]